MKILSFDPGFGRCGYAFCHYKTPIKYGLLETLNDESFSYRLSMLFYLVEAKIKEFNPDDVAIEIPVMTIDSENVRKVNEAIGAIRLICFRYDFEMYEYTPQAVKKAATLNGRAKKTEVKKAVCDIYNIPYKGLIDDVADALAVNYTHLKRRLDNV